MLALAAPAALAGSGELVDRVVAVVDDDPILLSDVRRAVALGMAEGQPEEDAHELERHVLDGLIDQRLRLHEVERYDFGPLPSAEIDLQVESIRSRFSDPAAFERQLLRLGLDEERLRQLVARQLRVLIYVEQRLAPRVFVGSEDVRAYYEGGLATELAERGLEPPPLAEVSGQIHDLLMEVGLNEEITAWTRQLRLGAEILDHLDRPDDDELPPVVWHIE